MPDNQTSLPVAMAPSAAGMNTTSLIRTALATVAGVLIVPFLSKAGIKLSNSDLQALAGAIVLIGTIVWNAVKNRNVTRDMAAAMTAPPVRLVGPNAPPPIVTNLFVVLAILPLLGLGGCLHTKPIIPPQSPVATDAVIAATAVDAAYNEVAKLYLAAPKDIQVKLKPDMVRAYSIVGATDTGQVLFGETSLVNEINDAKKILADLTAALAAKP